MMKWLRPFASLTVTNIALACLFILVFWGTLAQVDLGIYLAQKHFFQSLFVFLPITDTLSIPIFPGGSLLGLILSINLVATIITRKLYQIKKLGLFLIHMGLLTLIIGGGLSSLLSQESMMAIQESETKNFSEDFRENELIFTFKESTQTETVISVPESKLKPGQIVSIPGHSFKLHIQAVLPNSQVQMKNIQAKTTSLPNVTRGIGLQVEVSPEPLNTKDDSLNQASIFVEILNLDNRSMGTWLVSTGLGMPQQFSIDNTTYTMILRRHRYYTPYSIYLNDFKHDVYPGTQIPKNFSSLVTIIDPEKNITKDVLIYMNHPLRYQGKTYYQASFGQNDTLSVLQVVENPGWLLPYFSCTLIAIGMLIHFLKQLFHYATRRKI